MQDVFWANFFTSSASNALLSDYRPTFFKFYGPLSILYGTNLGTEAAYPPFFAANLFIQRCLEICDLFRTYQMLNPSLSDMLVQTCPATLRLAYFNHSHMHLVDFLHLRIQRTRRTTKHTGKQITEVTASTSGLDDWSAHIHATEQIQQLDRVVRANLNALPTLDAGCQEAFFFQSTRRAQ
jgi:hypothetical protein